MSLARNGISVLYRCCRLPGKCKERNTSACLTCRYSKAEMSGRDATRLMRRLKSESDTH